MGQLRGGIRRRAEPEQPAFDAALGEQGRLIRKAAFEEARGAGEGIGPDDQKQIGPVADLAEGRAHGADVAQRGQIAEQSPRTPVIDHASQTVGQGERTALPFDIRCKPAENRQAALAHPAPDRLSLSRHTGSPARRPRWESERSN